MQLFIQELVEGIKLKTEQFKMSNLKYPESNVRVHGEKQLEELKRSYNKFGQIRPVVIDDDGVILAGNGFVKAMDELGVETVEVLKMKNLTDNDKKKLMIADNKIYNLGRDDNDALFAMLESLDGDFDVPGFEDETLRELLADMDDIDDSVMSYGSINDEERKTFERSSELLDKRIDIAQKEREKETPEEEEQRVNRDGAYRETEQKPSYVPEDDESNKGDIKKSVRCPHCGETIWL